MMLQDIRRQKLGKSGVKFRLGRGGIKNSPKNSDVFYGRSLGAAPITKPKIVLTETPSAQIFFSSLNKFKLALLFYTICSNKTQDLVPVWQGSTTRQNEYTCRIPRHKGFYKSDLAASFFGDQRKGEKLYQIEPPLGEVAKTLPKLYRLSQSVDTRRRAKKDLLTYLCQVHTKYENIVCLVVFLKWQNKLFTVIKHAS